MSECGKTSHPGKEEEDEYLFFRTFKLVQTKYKYTDTGIM